MSHRMRISVLMALATGLLAQTAVAQKTPPPALPPVAPPSRSSSDTTAPTSTQPTLPAQDYVKFLRGKVAIGDATSIPNDLLIERVCNGSVRQQVYVSPIGDFSMQLGSMVDSFMDASGDQAPESNTSSMSSVYGIPRRELTNCDLRARSSGFKSDVLSLVGLTPFGGNMDVGVIVVHRTTKIDGATLSATPYKAPKDAVKAYERGMDAEGKGKLDKARKDFETAVAIYPKYVAAWFQLGTVLQNQNQKDAARAAFTKATTIDTKYLPPYLSLAAMAYEAEHWTEVVDFSKHILDLDPLNHTNVTSYFLDLDPLNCSEAYYYNAFANYKLSRLEDAEKSGLKAEHLDLTTRFPQLHLILADIFARKNEFSTAITEMQTYLDLAPNAKDADQARLQLAKLEKLNRPKT